MPLAIQERDLLRVENLSISYFGNVAVENAGFTLKKGRALALIGESGSGKSTIAKAVLGLLPESARVSGRIIFEGRNLLELNERTLRSLRGRSIGFVPQDPQNAFNPVRTIGAHAHEVARFLGLLDATAERSAIFETFERVGLPDPARIYRSYPHQLSGGMLQRALIGLAVLPKPALIVADEPTSALDVTIQKNILDLLSDLHTSLDLGMLLVTHDLAIAAERSEDVVVLRNGEVQETGPSERVFLNPASQYARELQADVPSLNPFRFRTLERRTAVNVDTLVDVKSVSRIFEVDGRRVHALDGVSFSVQRGRTHALVGESGSGKTTLARLLLGLDTPDGGNISVDGRNVHGRSNMVLRDLRRDLQLVYQNPFVSLDPTWRVKHIVREPLDQYGIGSRYERDERVRETVRAVGLDEGLLDRRPAALSGGQRQRVAIARALALRPKVLVLDEPTSALDVTVQAGIFEALFELQERFSLTYLFISHDLSLVRQVADSVSVLRHGRLIEQGAVDRIFDDPAQPYTRTLLASIPLPKATKFRPSISTPPHVYRSLIGTV